MANVTYRNIFKYFGDTTAISNLNLEIKDKEFLVFVGPSGSGKSTALRMLAGLETIADGEILIGNAIVNQLPPKERNIGMVFQSYALYPHMSVYDNLGFGLKMGKTPKSEIDPRVKEAAELLDITDLLGRKPNELSSAQKQRVAVARAILPEPSACLMDEPLSHLDATLRVSARATLSKLHKKLGITFIYVTNNPAEAMAIGDRIAVLNKGELQQVDTPHTLYHQPANIFVATFIGNPSMNIFDATLIKEEQKIYIDTGDFRLIVPAHKHKSYQSYIGQEIKFGIRPEHIYATNFTPSDIAPTPVEATVDLIELLGDQLHLYGSTGSSNLVATVDSRLQTAIEEKVRLIFDMNQIHLFDPQSEQAIR